MAVKLIGKENFEVYGIIGNGQRIRKRGFKTKTEAQRWFTNERILFNNGESEYNKKEPSSDMSVQELYDVWIEVYQRKNIADSTIVKTKEVFANHILPRYGSTNMNKLDVNELQLYAHELNDKYVVQSKRILTYFNLMLKYAVKRQWLTENPFDMIEIPRANITQSTDTKAKSLDKAEFSAWLSTLDEHVQELGWQVYTALRLISETGMRPEELVALQWRDVHFESGMLTIRRTISRGQYGEYVKEATKTKVNRTIALRSTMMDLLKQWQSDSEYTKPTDFLFSTDGKFLSSQRPNKWVKKYGVKWELPFADERFRAYTFRHTFATLGLELGKTPLQIAHYLGHVDAHMVLNTYGSVTKQGQQETSDWLDAI